MIRIAKYFAGGLLAITSLYTVSLVLGAVIIALIGVSVTRAQFFTFVPLWGVVITILITLIGYALDYLGIIDFDK